MESDCIFCKIVRKEIPSEFVAENEGAFCLLSIAPDAPGHAIVIPKLHARNLYDLHEESFVPILALAQQVAKAQQAALAAEGANLIVNNEAPAGQAVFHAHFHIIPRHAGDGLHYGEHHEITQKQPLAEIGAQLRAVL